MKKINTLNYKIKPQYYFLIFTALLLLFFNDHFLKWHYHNWLTGKSSDFLGLFLLPIFLHLIWPKRPMFCVVFSGAFFIFWKSAWSSALIECYNQIAWIPITRVVDVTDLIALIVLPFSYQIIKDKATFHLKNTFFAQLIKLSFFILCSIVFVATSPPVSYYYQKHNGNLSLNLERKIAQDKKNILEQMARLGLIAQLDTTMHVSRLGNEQAYYIIPEIIIDEDTVKNLQFAIRQTPDQSWLYLNGMQLDKDLSDDNVEKKLRKYYRKLLDHYLLDTIIND